MVRSDQEVERLVRENEKLVQFVVNRYLARYTVPGMEREDLVSWAMIGLVSAARAWDPARSVSFATLACKVMERMLVRGVKREWKPERAAATDSLDSPLWGNGSDRNESVLERIADVQDVESEVLDGSTRAAVRTAVAELPEHQRRLIELRFFTDLPAAEAAQKLGVSRRSVFERQRLALRKLRFALAPAFSAEGVG